MSIIVITTTPLTTTTTDDMPAPTDNNISVKEYYEMSKYKDLETEIKKMWHLKITTVTVIVGTLGMMKTRTDNLAVPADTKYKNCTLRNYSST